MIELLITISTFSALLNASEPYTQTFDAADALDALVFTDRNAWKHEDGSLALVGKSKYKPPHRSPLNIALIDGREYGSFTLEADLMQTGKEYGHRDMCLFFNFQDPTHYYYIHIATKTDQNAHNIFIVNDAPRTKISTKTTDGHDWGPPDKWHKVKVVRDVESGKIELFVNGEKLMEATDKRLTRGYIGFGSFDDTGRVDNVRITGEPVSRKKIGFFGENDGDI